MYKSSQMNNLQLLKSTQKPTKMITERKDIKLLVLDQRLCLCVNMQVCVRKRCTCCVKNLCSLYCGVYIKPHLGFIADALQLIHSDTLGSTLWEDMKCLL